jgi:hypothetical protein
MISLLATLLAVACMFVTQRATAQVAQVPPAERARAEEVFAQAELADRAFDFTRALTLYDETRTIDPASARAPKAEARAAVLRAHAEGDFRPFQELEQVRRSPAASADASIIDLLVEHAEKYPPGLTRVEVWVLAAEAYEHRFGRPADAERLYARVVRDERADPVIAKKAARDLVTMQLAKGDLAAAQATVALAGPRADDKLAKDVARIVRRRQVHLGSIVVLAAVALLAGFGIARALRRANGRATIAAALSKTTGIAIVYAAYVAISGAVLASSYEAGTSAPFLVLGIVIVPLVLVARAWGAAGTTNAGARAGRAVACAASAMAAAFLVLETINASFLEGMGL